MNKADHKFHRDKREQIDSQARENDQPVWFKNIPRPIYIPKRKKKK